MDRPTDDSPTTRAADRAAFLDRVEQAEREIAERERREELMNPGGDYVPADPTAAMFCDRIERTEGRARARQARRSFYHEHMREMMDAAQVPLRRRRVQPPALAVRRAGRACAQPRSREHRSRRASRSASRAGPSDLGEDGGPPPAPVGAWSTCAAASCASAPSRGRRVG